MSKQKIVSIEIELKDYEPIKFTMDEARELYDQLDTLFGDKVIHHHYDRWWYRPYVTWSNTCGDSINLPATTTEQCYVANAMWNSTVSSENTGMKVTYSAPANGVDL